MTKEEALVVLKEMYRESVRSVVYYKEPHQKNVDIANALNAAICDLEKQSEIIRCRDCKWWGYDDDDGAVRVCHAAKHGHMSSHWNIMIYRQYKGDYYCADAERKEE